MITRFQLVGICLAIGLVLVVAGIIRTHKADSTSAQDNPAAAETGGVSAEERAANLAAYERETQANIEHLNKLKAARDKQGRANSKTEENRKLLQFSHQAAWSNMIATNQATYQQLLKQAAKSPAGAVPCTICGGKLYLGPCLLCTDANGKCVTCGGSGRISGDEICPTCQGNGNCFNCRGSGRQPCPFCGDGVVCVKRLPLPSQIPIE